MGMPILPGMGSGKKEKKVKQGIHQSLYVLSMFFGGIAFFCAAFLMAFFITGIFKWNETGDATFLAGMTILWGIPFIVLLSIALLVRRLRFRYYYIVRPYNEVNPSSPFPYPITQSERSYMTEFGTYVEDPSQCRLCGKHPINKRYHLYKVHKLEKDSKTEDHYRTCGCDRCLRWISHNEG